MKKITLFSICMWCFLVTSSFLAQTRYISFSGNDTNDGLTAGTAYKTVAKALTDNPSIIIVNGTIDGSSWGNNILNGYTNDITIKGENTAIVNRGPRPFRIGGSINVTIEDITFNNPDANFLGDFAAFMFINGGYSGTLTFNNATINSYRANLDGGAIYFGGGATPNIIINNSFFTNNHSKNRGGAMYLGSANLTVTNSSFSGNKADNEDGDTEDTREGTPQTANDGQDGGEGGAIRIAGSGTITLTNSTFYNNQAEWQGSAIWDGTGASHTITNCTFYQNNTTGTIANGDRAAAYRTEQGTYTVTNSLFYGNTYAKNTSNFADFSFVGGGTSGTINNSLAGVPQGNNLTSGGNVNLSALTLSTTTFTFNTTTGKVTYGGPGSIADATPIDFYVDGTRKDAGAWESNINLFNGSGATWSNASSWSSGVIPTSTEDITIPSGLANNPVIASNDQVTINDLFVNGASSLTIESGGSFIVNGGSVQGTVTAKRTIDEKVGGTEGWYLMSSPFNNEVVDAAFVSTNDIADNGTVRGVAYYNPNGAVNNKWTYISNTDNDDVLTAGKGFSLKRSTDGGAVTGVDVTFSGALNIDDNGVDFLMTTGGDNFNLIGNPYTASINLQTIIVNGGRNGSNLALNQIWLWNQDTKNYDVKTIGGSSFDIAPMQGFFVQASSAVNFEFEESDQIHATNTFQKSSETGFQILATDGELDRYAKVYFYDNATTSFDNGYDGETFAGVTNSFDVFTQLLSNDIGKKYQIQALPKSDIESFEIPLGITSKAGKEITFSALYENLPQDLDVYLEDRTLGVFTKLNENNTYKITIDSEKDGIGRFYVRTSSKALSLADNIISTINVYQSTKNTLTLNGLEKGKTNVTIYNILGKEMFSKSFTTNGVENIKIPNVNSGVYLINVENANKSLKKKIVLE